MNNEKKTEEDVIKIKQILRINGMEKYADKLMYVPQVPMVGIEKRYIIEEWYGLKVARLISLTDE